MVLTLRPISLPLFPPIPTIAASHHSVLASRLLHETLVATLLPSPGLFLATRNSSAQTSSSCSAQPHQRPGRCRVNTALCSAVISPRSSFRACRLAQHQRAVVCRSTLQSKPTSRVHQRSPGRRRLRKSCEVSLDGGCQSCCFYFETKHVDSCLGVLVSTGHNERRVICIISYWWH